MLIFQLERTCLHYAMALDSVEELSSILIKAGAKRTIKDLVRLFITFMYIEVRFMHITSFISTDIFPYTGKILLKGITWSVTLYYFITGKLK